MFLAFFLLFGFLLSLYFLPFLPIEFSLLVAIILLTLNCFPIKRYLGQAKYKRLLFTFVATLNPLDPVAMAR